MKSWREAKEDLESTTLFLVHRTGPTVYQIKDEAGTSCRVMLGGTHSCTCQEKGFCKHLLFVLLKVLRIPPENALSQKNGFTDMEIDVALAGNFENRTRPMRQSVIVKKKRTTVIGKQEENTVDRQILNEEEEEICPICQDDMKKEHMLTWCRKGCGNNIHAKCMKMYAQFNASSKKDILCPLCRECWGPLAMHIINDDCKGKASLKKACANVACVSCTFQIRGDFYRCIECSVYGNSKNDGKLENDANNGPAPVDFCKTCFKNIGRSHSKHHFVTSSTNSTVRDFSWESVKNPRAPPHVMAAELLENLQNRELTNEDYDVLLDLDKPEHTSFQDSMLNAMPRCENNLHCWCGEVVTTDNSKTLVCGHAAHIECCRVRLNEAIEDGFWKLEEVKCSHTDCGCPLFKGLARRRRKVNKVDDATDQQPGSEISSRAPLTNSFMIAGAGISSSATGIATPLYNERSDLSIALGVGGDGGGAIDRSSRSIELGGEPSHRPDLMLQAGRLSSRQAQSTLTAQSRSTRLIQRRRGLALSGRGGGSRLAGEDTSISLVEDLSHLRPARRTRSTSATGQTPSQGTSSFAAAKTNRRESMHSRSEHEREEIVSEEIDTMLKVVSSSGLLHNGISGAPPIGMVPPRHIPPRRGHVSRIRGLTGRVRAPQCSEGSERVQICLNVSNYA